MPIISHFFLFLQNIYLLKAFPMKLKLLILLSIVVCFISCVTNYHVRKSAKIETLSICLNYDETVPDSVKTAFDAELECYMKSFNEEQRAFYVKRGCDSINTFTIYISDTKLIGYELQKMSVIESVVGLALPIAMISAGYPFYVGYVYIPRANSKVYLTLTEDISSLKNGTTKILSSDAFLLKMKKQIKYHRKAFRRLLRDEIEEIEDQYIKR